ncbi:MAG: hypothetical protein KGI45_00925 [Patescibacteria group bacterium]|nr:hypothetical protein [Patescibacteria group bacterium]MDE1941350.1 hypothetical protein [Patescibacteria group bacterium]MDE1966620.1 hypothetical protein [Patescibacteria group bacterium]
MKDSLKNIISAAKANKGYTLLFSVLVAVLVLGVAVFIVGFAEKQYILASTARESMYAIYAADGALECGAAAVLDGQVSSTTQNDSIHCGNYGGGSHQTNDLYPIPTSLSSNPQPVSWTYNMISLDNNECARIVITTGLSLADNSPTTVIDSYGYNDCVGSGPQLTYNAVPTTVERAFELTYHGIW